MTRAVIFDLFGTLVLPWPIGDSRALARGVSTAFSVDEETFRRGWRGQFDGFLTGPFEANFDRVMGSFGIREASGHEVYASVRRARIDLTREHLAAPRHDTIATLQTLRARHIGTALISDCSSEVPEVWPDSPIAPLIDAAVFSCVEGMRKPDPRMYRRACEMLSVSPSECLYVGDGGSDELSGATRAGMRAIQIVPGDTDPRDWSGEVIVSLGDLLPLI